MKSKTERADAKRAALEERVAKLDVSKAACDARLSGVTPTRNSRRVLLVMLAVLALAVLVQTSCGGSDGSDASAPPEEVDHSQELAEIREDFEFNFSTTSWYTPAETLFIEGDTLVARTDWYVDDEGRMIGEQLCGALNGNYVRSNTADHGLERVAVYGGNGELLASCSG